MSLESMSRTDALLAMLLVQGMSSASQTEKAVALSRAGLTNGEIATLLDTTTAVVSQSLYSARKTKSGPAKKAGVKAKSASKAAR